MDGRPFRQLHEGEFMNKSVADSSHAFAAAERAAVYKCIFTRRDVRGQFRPIPWLRRCWPGF